VNDTVVGRFGDVRAGAKPASLNVRAAGIVIPLEPDDPEQPASRSAALQAEMASDNHPLDFVRTFPDLENLLITVQARDG
jgi:hypothetical protein